MTSFAGFVNTVIDIQQQCHYYPSHSYSI